MARVTPSQIDIDDSLTGCRRRRRVLWVMLAASIALHAAALVWLPELARQPEPSPPRPLDVVVLPPVPAPEPVPVAPPPQRRETRVPQAAAPGTPREVRKPEPEKAPVIALPESRPSADSFAMPAEKPKAVLPVPPQKAEAPAPAREAAAISPPSFNAAYLRNPPPGYPLIARRNGEQGTVTLKVLVTRDGVPASVAVEKSSGSSHLDSAALETVRTWRFVPARQGSQPVEAWVLVPIVFRLEGAS